MSMILSTGKELTDAEAREAYYKQDKVFNLTDLKTVLEDMDRSLDDLSEDQKESLVEEFDSLKQEGLHWYKAAHQAIEKILDEEE